MIKFFKKRWYLILIIILIISYLFYKNNLSKAKIDKENSYTVKRENLKETLSLSGEIDATEKVALKFQTSGRLNWVGVKEGDFVKKYQMIASLDKRDIQNRLNKYLNTYASSRNSFEQTKDDNWNLQYDLSGSIRKEAERVLENNQFSLDNTVLDVEYQNLSLEYANLWTPIEGIVTHIDTLYPGVNITPAGAEFDIVNPKTIYLSVTVEQSDVVLLKVGMEGEIVFDAYPDKTFTGVIDYISFTPKTGETGTVYEVKLILDKEAQKLPLKLAMTGDVSFVLSEKKNVLSMPIQFVKKNNKGDYVIREKKGRKEKIYVKRGEEFDSKVEIKNGLEVGDIVYD